MNPHAPSAGPIDVSIVIGTRNRAAALERLLRSLFVQQAPGITYEILVVDNGSTDDTKATVERLAAEQHPVRYLAENRPGVSYARNTGVLAARAGIVAFADDDQEADAGWVAVIARTFAAMPHIDFIAGRVRPRFTAPAPTWMTPELQGAVSIIEWGDEPRPIDRHHWMCLPGGNMACRRNVFLAVGGFRAYPRTEDRELTVRLLLAGREGIALPGLVMYHHVDARRATKAYFRQWNAVEGRMRAAYRFMELFSPEGEIGVAPSGGRRVLGVPAYIYREVLSQAFACASAWLRGRPNDCFAHELKTRYIGSYILARINGVAELPAAIEEPRRR